MLVKNKKTYYTRYNFFFTKEALHGRNDFCGKAKQKYTKRRQNFRYQQSREGDDRSYLVGAQDIHEASIAFQSRVRQMYLRQAELDPSFKVLGCSDESGAMESPDVIFASLQKMVDEAIDR